VTGSLSSKRYVAIAGRICDAATVAYLDGNLLAPLAEERAALAARIIHGDIELNNLILPDDPTSLDLELRLFAGDAPEEFSSISPEDCAYGDDVTVSMDAVPGVSYNLVWHSPAGCGYSFTTCLAIELAAYELRLVSHIRELQEHEELFRLVSAALAALLRAQTSQSVPRGIALSQRGFILTHGAHPPKVRRNSIDGPRSGGVSQASSAD